MGGGSGDSFGNDFTKAAKTPEPSPSEGFSLPNYAANKYSDYVLRILTGYYDLFYDFKARLVIMQTSQGLTTTPFAQMEREALIEARDELVRQGGKPPPLPGDKPVEQKPDRLEL